MILLVKRRPLGSEGVKNWEEVYLIRAYFQAAINSKVALSQLKNNLKTIQ